MPPRDAAEMERRLNSLTERLLGAFEELEFLHTMSQALARPQGVGDLDAYLLQETRTLFHADGGWVARRRDDRLVVVAVDGFPPEIAETLTQRLLSPLA